MPDFLLAPRPMLEGFVSPVLALLLVVLMLGVQRLRAWWCRRGRCPHTRYRGAADVVCLSCRRDRARVADHLRRASGGGVPMPGGDR